MLVFYLFFYLHPYESEIHSAFLCRQVWLHYKRVHNHLFYLVARHLQPVVSLVVWSVMVRSENVTPSSAMVSIPST